MASSSHTEGYLSTRNGRDRYGVGLDTDVSVEGVSGHDNWRDNESRNTSGNGNVAGTTRRNPFGEVTSLINHGGLGRSPTPPRSSSRNSQAPSASPTPSNLEITAAINAFEKTFFPGQPRSLSGIALRSFLLGLVLALSLALTFYLAAQSNPLWRLPFFLASLSIFHFVEFYTTALTNTPAAGISSFLLASNGLAYTIAHTAALTECLLSHLFHPLPVLPTPLHYITLLLGFALILLGQPIRAIAMLQAGSNFSHIVAQTKRSSHRLVTEGIYSVLRHPSYFGYFWWAIGTQLMCGNVVCLVGYAFVLWRFFQRRIEGEEELLTEFFRDEYVQYKERSWVGIPGIG